MKNNVWFILACVLIFFAGYNLDNAALSSFRYRVAVVDVGEILSNSKQIKELKIAQDKETEELNTLISKAQNDLLNETDRSKLIQKEETYRRQIDEKKKSIEDKYGTQLSKINDEIKLIIAKEAQKENYNLVLPAGMVISGGEDITGKVIKQIK